MVGEAVTIRPEFGKRNIPDPFARRCGRMNTAQKGKTLCALHQLQKVLVVELLVCPT
jgi:hypothetical protein